MARYGIPKADLGRGCIQVSRTRVSLNPIRLLKKAIEDIEVERSKHEQRLEKHREESEKWALKPKKLR